jgi:hypothetical protein
MLRVIMTHDERALTTIDWLLAILAMAIAGTLVVLAFFGRSFAKIFADLGADDVPLLARLASSTWVPLLCAAAIGSLAAIGVFVPVAVTRRACLAVAIVLGGLLVVIDVVSLYSPIFRLADSIK